MKWLKLRLIALFKIFTSKNIIMLYDISEGYSEEKQSKTWKYTIVRNTNLDDYGDFSVLKGCLFNSFEVEIIEEEKDEQHQESL